jgi:hypothetical protein
MRMMLKFTLPVEKGNAAIKDGTVARTMESIMQRLKPEAAYWSRVCRFSMDHRVKPGGDEKL